LLLACFHVFLYFKIKYTAASLAHLGILSWKKEKITMQNKLCRITAKL